MDRDCYNTAVYTFGYTYPLAEWADFRVTTAMHLTRLTASMQLNMVILQTPPEPENGPRLDSPMLFRQATPARFTTKEHTA